MLRITPAPPNEYPRLHLQGVRAPAWIEHRSWHQRGIDWQLWVERQSRVTSAKCPLRLEIESRLRSWLLRVSGMPLHTLTYTWCDGLRADHGRKHETGGATITRGLDARRPITEALPCHGCAWVLIRQWLKVAGDLCGMPVFAEAGKEPGGVVLEHATEPTLAAPVRLDQNPGCEQHSSSDGDCPEHVDAHLWSLMSWV
jgi:hypothetical protein